MIDAARVRDHLLTFSSHPNYDRSADIDGSGLIQRSDLLAAVRNGWTQLSSGPARLPVPEPSSLALAALGLIGCAVRRRGRR